jgi:very-short-patch-repair endonuclease
LIKDGRIKVIEAYSNKKIEKKEIKLSQAVSKNRDSLPFKDEQYVIDLCNKILGLKAKRQYRFDFLLGDPNKDGKCVKLPVDAYYPDKNLVVEYCESQHTEGIKFFDKPDRITLNGVHRGLQRKIYDSRRLSILPQHGINVIQISYSDFACNRKNRIIRNRIVDEEIVKNKLKQFLLK